MVLVIIIYNISPEFTQLKAWVRNGSALRNTAIILLVINIVDTC